MFHKENNTLDLLGQYSQKNAQSPNSEDEPQNNIYRELGQFISKTDKKEKNHTFGIPNFLWYLAMIGMLIYILRGMDFSQINNASDVLSTIQKTVSSELSEMQQETQKAIENANTHKEQK